MADGPKCLYLYSLCQKSFMSFGQKSFGQQMSGGHCYREAFGGFKSLLWNCKHQPSVCWPNGFWLLDEKPFWHKEFKKWHVDQLTVDKMRVHSCVNQTLWQENVCWQNCFWPKSSNFFDTNHIKCDLSDNWLLIKWTGHGCVNQTLC